MADEITTEWVRLGDGPDAYVAAPRGHLPLGAVVAGAEMFGLTEHARGVCDRLARAGYAVVAPDFYWRDTRLAALGHDDAGRDEGRRLMNGLDRDEVLADVAMALEAATHHADTGGTAMVGLSLVGHIAMLAATRIPLNLAVNFYGGWTLSGGIPLADPPPLSRSAAIAANGTYVLGFVGSEDFLISTDEWREIDERLTADGVAHELVSYPGVAHGFCNDERPETFDAHASADAWQRVTAALQEHVASVG